MNYLAIAEHCFLDAPGGAGRVAWDIAQLMRDRGHAVTLLCEHLPASKAAVGLTIEHGVRIYRYSRLALPAWHPFRLRGMMQSLTRAAAKWMAGKSWDVVHFHSPVMGRAIIDALGAGPRYVFTAHSPIVLEQRINWGHGGWVGKLKLFAGLGALRALERDVLRDCDHVHTLSHFTREKLLEQHGHQCAITVIPHWCTERSRRQTSKAEARQALGWPADKKIFFSVRQLRHRYGIDVAIRAIAAMSSRTDAMYYVAGQGALRGSLEQLTNDLEVSDNVHFLGRISDSDLELAYRAADVFVLPTRELECFGLIILEALSAGCPLLATNAGAIPEVLSPVLRNCIVPAGDPVQLSRKLDAFVDGHLQFPGAEDLIATVNSVYGAARICPQLLELLELHPVMRKQLASAA